MDETSKEWSILEIFHKSHLKSNQLSYEGVKAFIEIANFAKKRKFKVPRHPSFNVRFGSTIYYNWLIKVNKLIKIISSIPNYKPRLKRFFNESDYFKSLSALYELETALRLKLQGISVAFTVEKSPDKTPDIEIKINNQCYNLEITTINNPDDDKKKQEFLQKLVGLEIKNKVKFGGIIYEVPKHPQNEILSKIENKIIEAKEKRKITKMIDKGKFTLEFAPRELKEKMKLTGFVFIHKELNSIEDKIISVIKDKSEQLYVNQHPGILCIYGGSRTFDIESIYSKAFDKINFYLQTLPELSGLVLSLYSDFYPIKDFKPLKQFNNSKLLVVLKPGFGETEQSIIWKNQLATHSLPKEFINSYQTFELKVSEIL
ncbi:MAG: hypothetical protein ACTSP3_05875 [Candidatus Heimdallarchaeaceae archaeon]